MHSVGKDWRTKHNINMFDPRAFNVENYFTDAHQKEVKNSYGDDLLNNLHLLSDPLKKNLADNMVTTEEKMQNIRDKMFLNTNIEPPETDKSTIENHNHTPTFAGITNFFSGVLGVISGAMAHWRPKSPVQYHDCFDDVGLQGSPLSWHSSNDEVQNKSVQDIHSNSKSAMNIDCQTAAAQCEDKLNKVRLLLSSKPVEKPKLRQRRPKKAFVEAGSVEECFEDAFTPEDFIRISNNTYIEYYGPYQIENQNLLHTAAPKIKIEKVVNENTDIIQTLPEVPIKSKEESISESDNMTVKQTTGINTMVEIKINENIKDEPCKQEIVSSCEDKLSKLKALLQEKCKKKSLNYTSDVCSKVTIPSNDKHVKSSKHNMKMKDKCYKNPCRTTDKRKKCNLKKSIQDDLLFAQEIDSENLSSIGNSPSVNSLDRLSDTSDPFVRTADVSNDTDDYFDEVSGRFRSTSTTESEDSFQIVFSDSPKQSRVRKMSDCDSEDSFIVFEESPDSCYTSNEVFGNSDESDTEYTDSEGELSDTEDVQVTKLTHSLSRTMSDLTDGSLYDENSLDEVDCAVRSVCDEIPIQEIKDLTPNPSVTDNIVKSTGLLLNEDRKKQKLKLPSKSVRFSTDPPKVHVMRVWAFAARQARAGHWERCALDRDRFKRRIADVDMAVSWVLQPRHRARIMFQRFMPWWNALKRKELADKKAREEEERIKKEEQQKREVESLKQDENLVTDNDTVSDNIVHVDDTEQKHINESYGNDISNNDTNKVISDIVNDIENKDKDKVKNLKCNGFVNKTEMSDKSLLNDNSLKIILVNDKQNNITSIMKSKELSNT